MADEERPGGGGVGAGRAESTFVERGMKRDLFTVRCSETARARQRIKATESRAIIAGEVGREGGIPDAMRG
jgi:hypothetical protein